jgi:O-acetylhomoserine (thiol)-lyase
LITLYQLSGLFKRELICHTVVNKNEMTTKEIKKMAYKFETLQLHVGQEKADPASDARAVPIYQTTSYVFHDSNDAEARFNLRAGGNIYGRLTNSTQGVLEERVAALEGGSAALAVASGAAAISYTIEALAANGGHIVAQKTIYGGSYNLLSNTLPQYGIETTFVDAHNLAEVEGAIKDRYLPY